MEKRELTCIGCPLGCAITVTMDGGELKDVTVPAPVHIGDVLLPNVAGTGVDIIATKAVQ